MSDIRELEDKIRKLLPRLQNIEVGQIFHSKYYGNITATQITEHGKNIYSIYGFCEEGMPRSNYYPKDMKLVGKPIMLNDVLNWLSILNVSNRYYDINFDGQCFNEINKYSDGDIKDTEEYNWDLNSSFLSNQSKELIRFLNNINYD